MRMERTLSRLRSSPYRSGRIPHHKACADLRFWTSVPRSRRRSEKDRRSTTPSGRAVSRNVGAGKSARDLLRPRSYDEDRSNLRGVSLSRMCAVSSHRALVTLTNCAHVFDRGTRKAGCHSTYSRISYSHLSIYSSEKYVLQLFLFERLDTQPIVHCSSSERHPVSSIMPNRRMTPLEQEIQRNEQLIKAYKAEVRERLKDIADFEDEIQMEDHGKHQLGKQSHVLRNRCKS